LKPVKNVMKESTKDLFCKVYERGTIFQIIESLFSEGVHRVPVMDDTNKIVNILSQSDVIHFLAENKSKFGHLGHLTVEELNLSSSKEAITMSCHAPAIQAFYLMSFNKVSAVAVVDVEGKLIGNISASDIRGLVREKFPALLKPIPEFFCELTGHESKPVISCKNSTTLLELVKIMDDNRIHRVWVVDDISDVPIGLVAMTDIMKLFSDIVV